MLLTTLDDKLAGERFRDHLIPISQQEGLHLKFAQSVNFHPVATVGDLENYLRRLRAFPAAVDATIVVMRQGMAERRVPPRITMAQTVPQFRALAVAKAEESPLWGIVARLPADWAEADRARIAAEVRAAIEGAVSPAYAKLADFVERDYLPACRESVGLWDSPDGAAHYAYLARKFTTTDLSPDEIHEIGLAEMARTRAAMEAIREKVGFEGDLPAFFRHLKADPKFKNASEADILAGYRTIFERIDAKLPELFGRLPRTDYGIRPIEAYRAKAAAAGYYYPAPEDGSRPGYFYVNTFEPTSRTTYTMQALAYHEGVPGHHLQFSLAMEAPGRPAFRRFGYVPAFSEGWGLYSESLPARSASTPTRTPSLASSNTTPGAPGGWSSTPACTTSAGPATGRSPTWRRTRPSPASRSRARSIATSPGRARPSPTRSASGRSARFAPRPCAGWARNSTSAPSTTACSPRAPSP